MTEKRFFIKSIKCFLVFAILIILSIVILDPFFHYHGPIKYLSYWISNQRYQNYGIMKHFEYDAIITGTSMTENFLSSQFDDLFDVNSIKTAFFAGSFKETNDFLNDALEVNSDVHIILRSLDLEYIGLDKDYVYDYDYPTYLYDKNIFNDVHYVLNKSIYLDYNFLHIIKFTRLGYQTSSFDSYSSWGYMDTFSKEAVLENVERLPNSNKEYIIDYDIIRLSIEQNMIQIAKDNPNVEFHYFYTPYSIVYFDEWNQQNIVSEKIVELKYIAELLLEYDNIKVHSFLNEYDIITNLDNYKDRLHYHSGINEMMITKIYENSNLLTKENYLEHFKNLEDFYLNYDYEEIYENKEVKYE